MKTLAKKSNGFPSLSAILEDFWNTDKIFTSPLLNTETLPAVNVKDAKKSYQLEVAVPGFNKEDFRINTENGVLTISAETQSENKEENENYTRQEFSCNSFTRTFNLPENIVEEDITANYKDGILKIDLKKSNKLEIAKKEIKVS
jgi:HSP20 family protein